MRELAKSNFDGVEEILPIDYRESFEEWTQERLDKEKRLKEVSEVVD